MDMKLVSFSKLGAHVARGGTPSSGGAKHSGDDSPLLNKQNADHMFSTMCLEIEQLLERLTQLNDAMSQCLDGVGAVTGGAGFLHTLQRHRDILQDYSQEYNKTRSNIVALKEREDLLGSVQREIASYKQAQGMSAGTSLLLAEHEAAHQSERLIDQQLGLAGAVKENLLAQRGALRGVTGRLQALGKRFPLMNGLVQRINFRKRRDTLVLAGVTAFCLILLLMYLLS